MLALLDTILGRMGAGQQLLAAQPQLASAGLSLGTIQRYVGLIEAAGIPPQGRAALVRANPQVLVEMDTERFRQVLPAEVYPPSMEQLLQQDEPPAGQPGSATVPCGPPSPDSRTAGQPANALFSGPASQGSAELPPSLLLDTESEVPAGSPSWAVARGAPPREARARLVASGRLLQSARATPEMASLEALFPDQGALFGRFLTRAGIIQEEDVLRVAAALADGGWWEQGWAVGACMGGIRQRALRVRQSIERLSRDLGAAPERVAQAMATLDPSPDFRWRLRARLKQLDQGSTEAGS